MYATAASSGEPVNSTGCQVPETSGPTHRPGFPIPWRPTDLRPSVAEVRCATLGHQAVGVHMSRRRPILSLAVSSALLVSAFVTTGGASATVADANATAGTKPRGVVFSSDGMRPDLMERYAAGGSMPTYQDLMRTGVRGANGLTQAFPPNTGVGWYTLATGTW